METLRSQVQTLTNQNSDQRQQVQNLRNEQQEALEESGTHRQKITDLQTQLTEARTIAAALARTGPCQWRGFTRKIPKPNEFDGSRSKRQTFLTKLRLHTATFTDEQAKLRLAINCLAGSLYICTERPSGSSLSLNALIMY